MRSSLITASLVIALIGFALARGRGETEDAPAEPSPEAPPEASPTTQPPAPPLFPTGLPVSIQKIPVGLPSLSAQACNGCHYAAHDAWIHSRHAQAWSSPTFQAAVQAAGDSTVCIQCHLPLAAQHDKVAAGYTDGDLTRPLWSPNPAFDLSLRGEGVTCAACHIRDGVILGSHASTNAPHPVQVSTELGQGEFCATCHQLTWPGADRPFYDTWGEWKASAWASANVSCSDCHMAPESGTPLPGSNGTLPSHRFSADPQRAISVLLKTAAASAQRGQALAVDVTVQNTGAGHSFPTGNPQKSYTIEIVPVDSAGKQLSEPMRLRFERQVEATAPYATLSDTRLNAGGERKENHSFLLSSKGAAGRGLIEVRLVSSLGDPPLILQRIPFEFR